MAGSYEWNIFPLTGTDLFEEVSRNILDTWANNGSLMADELAEAHPGMDTLKDAIDAKSDNNHIHTPSGEAVNVDDIEVYNFFLSIMEL